MELKDLQQLISSLGFPIVVACWLLYRDFVSDRRMTAKLDRVILLLEEMNKRKE